MNKKRSFTLPLLELMVSQLLVLYFRFPSLYLQYKVQCCYFSLVCHFPLYVLVYRKWCKISLSRRSCLREEVESTLYQILKLLFLIFAACGIKKFFFIFLFFTKQLKVARTLETQKKKSETSNSMPCYL